MAQEKRCNWKLGVTACAVLFFLLAGTRDCHAFWWWRDSIASRWTDKPVPVNGIDMEWGQTNVLEDAGLTFRARNDSSNLYLMIATNGREGRSLLTGTYRQDVTFWFLGPNGKTKTWGICLAFSRFEKSTGGAEDKREGPAGEAGPERPAATADQGSCDGFVPRPYQERGRDAPFPGRGSDVKPGMVLAAGVEVSTPLPSDVAFHADLSGREPAYMLRIPLSKLNSLKGKTIPFNFVTSEVSTELKSQFEVKNAGPAGGPGTGASQGSGMTGGGGMGGGMGGAGMGGGMMGGGGMGGGRMGSGGMGGGRMGSRGMGGGMGGGGMDGGGMGAGGMGGSGQPPSTQAQELPEPLDLRLSVRLARQADAKQ